MREVAQEVDRAAAPGSASRGGRVLLFREAARSDWDDASIARVLIQGDSRAARLAWQRFAPMVHRMLRRAFGPEHDVDDLVQEVFLTLFARVHTLREPQALRAFVISITAHAIRYELRRKAALRWLRFGEPADARAVDADLDSREAVLRLYRILDQLGSGDRTAFVLRFLEGLELTEVSAALGVSLATTKRRLARAWRRVVVGAQRDAALVEYLAGLEPGPVP
ncbi:MAG TPA: sigma-70 family RNA polymerase sigma factor [Polyangiaceae bacterium]|nr:sigma-70 family RNA polymerase sigma factor [Polyangiaceae bacterium]